MSAANHLSVQFTPKVYEEQGTVGKQTHITRDEHVMLPIEKVANMQGSSGEVPGGHRNRQGEQWDEFKNDIGTNGMKHPVFITVEHGDNPKLSEGNHRRDAAVELGWSHVPAQVRYFGHAERQGLVQDR